MSSSETCPLEKHFYKREFYAKRMDLLPRGGGNKVPRFDNWFKNRGHIERVMSLSNPGSHTFHVLSHYLTDDPSKPGAAELIALEQSMKVPRYSLQLKRQYDALDNVTSSTRPFLIQLLIFLWHTYTGWNKTKTIGIGGHIHIQENPYEQIFTETLHTLPKGKIAHIFPVASGNMADCFLDIIKTKKLDHKLFCITTGAAITHYSLGLKYLFNRNMHLLPKKNADSATYQAAAAEFYKACAVRLDPVHTIQTALYIGDPMFDEYTVVIWITNPLIHQFVF